MLLIYNHINRDAACQFRLHTRLFKAVCIRGAAIMRVKPLCMPGVTTQYVDIE